MNNVQPYTPPRLAAILIGALIFAVYQLFWRDVLLETMLHGDQPVPLSLAIIFSGIIGYGVAMLGWLIWQTKGQVVDTFRPTRGRIIAALVMPLFTPLAVISYLPWIFGGLLLFAIAAAPLFALGICLLSAAIAYPITSMIVRHTYDRRLLRFGLFCLIFWTAYSGLLLYNGAIAFRL